MVIKTIEYHHKWHDHVFVGFWNKYNDKNYDRPTDTNLPPDQPNAAPPAAVAAPIATTAPTTAPAEAAANIYDANTKADLSPIRPNFNSPSGLAVQNVPESSGATNESEAEQDEKLSAEYRALSPQDQWRVNSFFSCYFLMTGLHGFHVLVGMGLITRLLIRAIRNGFSSEYYTPVDLIGLCWHLVDLIWIFLFPLLYLIH